ncbi:MAG: alpha/beta fold hydrolase [Planctomycetota bacterium]|nr:MAG: alpha/beta fold hydrolase [Planctomycetota bacterium]
MAELRSDEELEFKPFPLLSSGHLQTIMAAFLPQLPEKFPSQLHTVPLPDGDKLCVAVSTPEDFTPQKRTVVMIHGLTGDYQVLYLSRLGQKLFERGFQVVRLNLRNCGPGMGLARKPYHAGQSGDLREVLLWLEREGRSGPITVAGFSLGGNLALKLAGEVGETPLAGWDSVVGISAPICLESCLKLMERPVNRIYEFYFLRRMKAAVVKLSHIFSHVDLQKLSKIKTMREFDDFFTAPEGGFKDALDYYRKASAFPYISRIGIKALILTARDDPFIAVEPYERIVPRENLEVYISSGGGHLGFLCSPERGFIQWMDNLLLDWIERLDGEKGD